MTNNLTLVDVIDNFGLRSIGDFESIVDQLKLLDLDRIFELVSDLSDVLPLPNCGGSSFRYMGNMTNSGFPFPCESLECRSREFFNTVSFAGLYSDEYVLFNPFTHHRLFTHSDENKFRRELALIISMLISASPLINRGIITFVDSDSYDICYSCFGKGLVKASKKKVISEENNDFDLMMDIGNQIVEMADIVYEGESGGEEDISV